MKYTVRETKEFSKWLTSLKDKTIRARIARRIDSLAVGSFGDYKQLADNLFELRFFFGSGYRMYYTFKDGTIIFLLAGGR